MRFVKKRNYYIRYEIIVIYNILYCAQKVEQTLFYPILSDPEAIMF